MTTRVLIVDDHPMVTDGIEAILETYDDINVVGTLNNGQEAVDQIDTLAPDVVLLDLNMPGLSGLAATEMILEKRPQTHILILSMHDSHEYISQQHSATGPKDTSSKTCRQTKSTKQSKQWSEDKNTSAAGPKVHCHPRSATDAKH